MLWRQEVSEKSGRAHDKRKACLSFLHFNKAMGRFGGESNLLRQHDTNDLDQYAKFLDYPNLKTTLVEIIKFKYIFTHNLNILIQQNLSSHLSFASKQNKIFLWQLWQK